MPALIPSVKVALGDQERNLCFDVNAHIAFQEATGQSLIEAMQRIASDMKTASEQGEAPKMPSFSMIRSLLWAGLRSETLDADGNETEDTLSPHQIGSMLDFSGLMALLNQIADAFAKSMRGLPDSEPANPQKTPRRNGNRSTSISSGVSRTSNSGLGVSVASSR